MKEITPEIIHQYCQYGTWHILEQYAVKITSLAEKLANHTMRPILGGGTRLMLAIEHRISNDIDLFIDDPQWFGYLTPRLNYDIEKFADTYQENPISLRFIFNEGEIDYITGGSLLGLPAEVSPDCKFLLDPVAEVLAKKLFHRGHCLTARDLFDWRMIETSLPEQQLHSKKLAEVLNDKFDDIAKSLNNIGNIDAEHFNWNNIRTPYKLDLQETLVWAQNRLEQYKILATTPTLHSLQSSFDLSSESSVQSGEPHINEDIIQKEISQSVLSNKKRNSGWER